MTDNRKDFHPLVPVGTGGGGGVNDLPTAELDLTTNIQDLFGGTVDLGTDGFATMRWERVGRMVQGILFIGFDDDAVYPGGGPFYILGTDLPYEPRDTPLGLGVGGGFMGEAGLFGFLVDVPSTWFEPVATGTNDVLGSGTPVMVFPLADGNAGGINSLMSSEPTADDRGYLQLSRQVPL